MEREFSDLEYQSPDGRTNIAVLSMPKGEGPFPVVVTLHGGWGDRELNFIRSMAMPGNSTPTVDMLNEKPWAVLGISYRNGLFTREEDDVVAGIRFAKTLPRVDPSRVGVLGGSHGGQLALRSAEIMGKDICCVAAGSPWMTNPEVWLFSDVDAPPLSLVSDEARRFILNMRAQLLQGLTRRMPPEEIRKVVAEHSVDAHAREVAVPTLFMTSHNDQFVPRLLVEPTIAAVKAAGVEVSEYVARVGDHGFYWGREIDGVSAVTMKPRTPEEHAEGAAAREAIAGFFHRWFDRI